LKLTPATNTVSGVSMELMRFSVSALIALVAAASTSSAELARQGATGRAAGARSAVPLNDDARLARAPQRASSAMAMAAERRHELSAPRLKNDVISQGKRFRRCRAARDARG
jgi:hypothetical protein